MNAYFQLDMTPQGTNLIIHKETEGGDPINMNELSDYLTKKGIPFELADLNRKVMAVTNVGKISLDTQKRYPEREMIVVKISDDKMQAVCRFYPPSVGGNELSREDILSDLNSAGVTYGVDSAAIDKYISKRTYCTDFVFANGKPVRHGTDATVEYYFNTDLKAKPTVNEDGSVDFFNLNSVNHIKKGDLLAKLIREDPGEKGIDVCNNYIKPRDVKKLMLKFGHHVTLSEDKTLAYSDVSGHVMLVEGKIFVSDVYEVENVDASTGDITYEGSVKVNGNVNTNFTIKASGNIEVVGVVEGATLVAGGNITIARGINGMGKGNVSAGGNIIVKYVENATLSAGGFIQSEAIMHSTVSAKTEVIVDGRKGNISGSFVSARDSITVKSLGSQMGSDTSVQLGIDPTVKQRIDELGGLIDKASKNINQLLPVLEAFKQKIAKGIKLSPEQVKSIKDMSDAVQTLMKQREDYSDELDTLKDSVLAESKSFVIVKDVVFAGTKIAINDVSLTLKSDYRYCRFYKEKADIKMVGL